MNPEGAVRLTHRRELAAIAGDGDRKLGHERLIRDHYGQNGHAFNAASVFELDDVIKPSMA